MSAHDDLDAPATTSIDLIDEAKLLLIDGHSMAYRAFFALPVENFATASGQHTNAVYGFTSMLVNVLRDEAPTHVAVAFDKSRQTFRLETLDQARALVGGSATLLDSVVSATPLAFDPAQVETLETVMRDALGQRTLQDLRAGVLDNLRNQLRDFGRLVR